MPRSLLTDLPRLGVGIGYRPPLHDEMVRCRADIDFLEVLVDDYLYDDESDLPRLAELGASFPWVAHATGLSLGTAGGVDQRRVDRLAHLVEANGLPWWSEHLSFTRVDEVDTDKLQPLWFTGESVEAVTANVRQVRDRLPTPLLLENIAYYVRMPMADMDEAEFITRVLEEADVGLLLDVSNLHVNATNFGYDPYRFLDSVPLDRVVQVHLGGSRAMMGMLVDTHADPVADEAWSLLEYALPRAPVKAISLERDANLPALPVLLDELERARSIWQRCHARS